MVKQKRSWGVWALVPLFLGSVAGAEVQPQQTQPGTPQGPANNDRIKIWDDRVFDLNGGTVEPETRTSVGGTRRYLDKTKELDYNTEQRDRWIKNCASLRETNPKGFGECVDAQKKKELGGRTNFGARESSSGSDGLNKPSRGNAGLQGIKPLPAQEPSGETSGGESESAE